MFFFYFHPELNQLKLQRLLTLTPSSTAHPQPHLSYHSTLLHHLYPHPHPYSRRVTASLPFYSPSLPHTPALPTAHGGPIRFPFPDPSLQAHPLSPILPFPLHLPLPNCIPILDFLSSFLFLSARPPGYVPSNNNITTAAHRRRQNPPQKKNTQSGAATTTGVTGKEK